MLEGTVPPSLCMDLQTSATSAMEPDVAASASYRELQRADSCSVEHPWDHGTAHPRDGAADLNRGGAVSRYDAVNELDPWTDSAGAVFSCCEKQPAPRTRARACMRLCAVRNKGQPVVDPCLTLMHRPYEQATAQCHTACKKGRRQLAKRGNSSAR